MVELSAEEVLRFLREKIGPKARLWTTVESHLVEKTCRQCGAVFRPRRSNYGRGFLEVETERAWRSRECCSKSCSKKFKNPMHSAFSRQKMVSSLKRIRHKPPRLYGNGRSLTPHQISIHAMLGRPWKTEVAVPTGVSSRLTYPYCYKIDIADDRRKIGIEIDGSSHAAIERRKLDKKKDDFLSSIGWTIYRISHKRAEDLLKSCNSEIEFFEALRKGAPKEVRR